MAPSSCAAIRPLLSALIDGELSEIERAAVEHHLADCVDCRQRLEEYRAIGLAIGTLPRPEPPPELEQDIRRRLRDVTAEQGAGAAEGTDASPHPCAVKPDAGEHSQTSLP